MTIHWHGASNTVQTTATASQSGTDPWFIVATTLMGIIAGYLIGIVYLPA